MDMHIDVNTLKPIEEPTPEPESLYRVLATGIYRTKDDRFYHIHGTLTRHVKSWFCPQPIKILQLTKYSLERQSQSKPNADGSWITFGG